MRPLFIALLIALSLGICCRAGTGAPPMRVACLGDSLTEGDGDDGGGGYPARIQRKLAHGAVVKSFGVSGQTSKMVLDGYEQHPSQVKQALAFKPDLVCLWVGSNDLWYLYEYNNPTASDEAADVKHFRANVHAIVEAFRKRGIRVVIALLDDQTKRPVAIAGKAFSGISAAEMRRMSAQVKAYNAALRAEAAQSGCVLADFSTTPVFSDKATLSDDGNHPNASGYDRIADIWWKAISH